MNSDPAARYIRPAVVVNNVKLADAVREIYYAAIPETSAAIKIFPIWIARSLAQPPARPDGVVTAGRYYN